MANKYPLQQVGVADGTKNPPDKLDARQVHARKRTILASKVTADTWNIGDTVFLGMKKVGEKITGINGTAGASLGTTTLSIGPIGTPAAYVNAKTLTAIDTPTPLGPKASTLDDAPLDTDEAIWMTIGVAAVGAGVDVTIELELAALN